MSEFDLSSLGAPMLRPILAGDESPESAWGPEELRAVWACIRLSGFDDPPIPRTTISAVFNGNASPEELLLVKRTAKQWMSNRDSAVPPQVASMLYHAAIAQALLKHGQRITTIDNPQLIRGLQWAATQTWLDEPERQALAPLAEQISSHG